MRVAHSLIPEGLSEKGDHTGRDHHARRCVVVSRTAGRSAPGCLVPAFGNVQRAGAPGIAPGRQTLPENPVIMPGDLLHVDFCAGMLGLKTDTQQLAYVLRPGETDAPAGLKAGMAAANKVQDAPGCQFQDRRHRQRSADGCAPEGDCHWHQPDHLHAQHWPARPWCRAMDRQLGTSEPDPRSRRLSHLCRYGLVDRTWRRWPRCPNGATPKSASRWKLMGSGTASSFAGSMGGRRSCI